MDVASSGVARHSSSHGLSASDNAAAKEICSIIASKDAIASDEKIVHDKRLETILEISKDDLLANDGSLMQSHLAIIDEKRTD